MSDVMAIVSKAVFEKAAGKAPSLGQRLRLDRYVSANRGLSSLASGGSLFLVTVRPPDEALWLVAVLREPKLGDGEWVAAPCDTPLTDISALKSKLVFESGKGLPTGSGALAMSLQTPRALAASDVELLLAAAGGGEGSRSAPPADPGAVLLDRVLAHPDDEAARAALVEHWRAVDAPRAELADTDRLLRGPLAPHRRSAAVAARDALLAAHATRWWPWPLATRRQRDGLLVAVTLAAKDLAKVAPALLAAEPVTELEVTGASANTAAAIASAPWASRLRSLAVRGEIGDDGAAALFGSRYLASLRALNLSSNELSAEAFDALDSGLPALSRLVLTNNPIGDEGASALARWKHLSNLRTLYLSACELSGDGLTALGGSGKLTQLEKLTLAQNELGDTGAAALAALAPSLPALRHLELADISVRDPGAKALAAAGWKHLRTLDLSDNWCSRKALYAAYGKDVVR